jgi:hypothetical protein
METVRRILPTLSRMLTALTLLAMGAFASSVFWPLSSPPPRLVALLSFPMGDRQFSFLIRFEGVAVPLLITYRPPVLWPDRPTVPEILRRAIHKRKIRTPSPASGSGKR